MGDDMCEEDQNASGQQPCRHAGPSDSPSHPELGGQPAPDQTPLDAVDEAGEESFPASDPPAWTTASDKPPGTGRAPPRNDNCGK